MDSEQPAGRAAMAYSDMSVIDGDGRNIASSLREIRPRLRYAAGENLAEIYFFRNCTAGCSMLIRSDIAKQALPFPTQTVYDHWLAIAAAHAGRIAFLDKPLVRYRQHGSNQTGILTGVTDKASYCRLRIAPLAERLERCEAAFSASPALATFVRARLTGDLAGIWNGRRFSPMEAWFEIGMKVMPEGVFRWVIGRTSQPT